MTVATNPGNLPPPVVTITVKNQYLRGQEGFLSVYLIFLIMALKYSY